MDRADRTEGDVTQNDAPRRCSLDAKGDTSHCWRWEKEPSSAPSTPTDHRSSSSSTTRPPSIPRSPAARRRRWPGARSRAGRSARVCADHGVLGGGRCRRRGGDHPAVREAFERAGGDQQALVARSSSVVEDTATSSMAGQFESVIGISGFDAFVAAVTAVLDSRQRAGAAEPSDRGARATADRAAVRWRDVRHRPGDRSHRPPGRDARCAAGPSRW